MNYLLGIDVGSTTVKAVLCEEQLSPVFKRYERHNARAKEMLLRILQDLRETKGNISVHIAITGSAGLGLAQRTGLPFIQEVIATTTAVERLLPGTDAVIELGGEDAKIIFFGAIPEQRMNGTCAGGTGAFIDQMATLMDLSVDELNALAADHRKIYPIASRCGVFAKSDIQPLLNQGAGKEDIAASVLQAVVNQTIGGLAQGRKISGKVAFLGGPLAFLPELRKSFVRTLGLPRGAAVFPEDAQFFVGIGCAAEAANFPEISLDAVLRAIEAAGDEPVGRTLQPLFRDEAEYAEFCSRHHRASVPEADSTAYTGKAYLGIDAGSTTTKLVLLTEDRKMLYSFYAPNKGNPVQVLRKELQTVRALCGDRIEIAGAAVTGYGEELMVNAFRCDAGIVETMAHYYAAAHFDPDVDYIVDIGGQDIKCFRVRNHAIDSITLNEACSSGCGSFIETFAKAIGYDVETFARLGLFSKKPADLGSRCTVFMNSSVKQAQKEGADVEDISAGLSISVVKNALYKVIRVVDPKELGEHIVVQGGTFINDAILRAFEQELRAEVVRPEIAGLMGAFGCAIYASSLGKERSDLVTSEELEQFEHTSMATACALCENRCTLTVNRFSGGKRFITGNKCERGAGGVKPVKNISNLYQYKYKKLMDYPRPQHPRRGGLGIPMVLNFYDLLPYWAAFFASLGIEIVLSARSSHELYQKGQDTIPSDTVCYPAKLVHGHIADLVSQGVKRIFYPVAPYNNREEKRADNYYNCPVVAYYPELIRANMHQTGAIDFLTPYLVPGKPSFPRKAYEALKPFYPDLKQLEIRRAVRAAQKADRAFREDLAVQGQLAIDLARQNGRRMVVLAGRPYHIDPEINHGIDRLITSLGMTVLSEESVAALGEQPQLRILNQWTYHTRMYNAADYASRNADIEFVQLVSFGCGTDAITGDEIRSLLESRGRLYTQIKIDEISNLGAAKIRLRSLKAAIQAKEEVLNG